MILHLIKLVWNRKRTNGLVVVEIGISFLVLCAVLTWAAYYWNLYHQPMGFSIDRLWNVRFGFSRTQDRPTEDESTTMPRRLYEAIRAFEEVETAAIVPSAVPYGRNTWGSDLPTNDESSPNPLTSYASDGLKEALGLTIVQGRWFEEADGALNWTPVVINQRLRDMVFGAEDPIGKPFGKMHDRELRVAGVMTDLRKQGEFARLQPFVLIRYDLDHNDTDGSFVVKIRPGTPDSFEEKLMNRLQTLVPTGQFRITPIGQMRSEYIEGQLIPLIMVGSIAAFLIIMVGLGLIGVLWQNVTQRTAEIGLRRAFGGSAQKIYTQILGELLVITSIGVLLGTVIVVQFPLLAIIGHISTGVYLNALGLSLLVIYAITVVAGLYPSWLATRVQPATALHYE